LWHIGNNKQASVPLSISITSPKHRVPPDGEAFSGQVKGLKPGQTIWLFSKQVADSVGKPFNSGAILINKDHCDVVESAWSCPPMRVGGPAPRNNGTYRVWVTVVEPRQARQLLRDVVENQAILRDDANEPPYSGEGGIDSKDVLRS
jgi:hypothetical protein